AAGRVSRSSPWVTAPAAPATPPILRQLSFTSIYLGRAGPAVKLDVLVRLVKLVKLVGLLRRPSRSSRPASPPSPRRRSRHSAASLPAPWRGPRRRTSPAAAAATARGTRCGPPCPPRARRAPAPPDRTRGAGSPC